MKSTNKLLFFSLLSIFLLNNSQATITYNVVDLGANPDGITDSTPAFLSAWNSACGSSEQAIIYVPQGSFLLQETHFNGPCKCGYIFMKIEGTIVAPPDYNVLRNTKHWIYFQAVDGLIVQGGVLDGRGSGLWQCKRSGNSCPGGATVSKLKRKILVWIRFMKNGKEKNQ